MDENDGFDLTAELVNLANDDLTRYLHMCDLRADWIVTAEEVERARLEYDAAAKALVAACVRQDEVRVMVEAGRRWNATRLQA